MKLTHTLTLAAALCLTACAGSGMFDQPPAELVKIHTSAKARITYQKYFKRDWRYIPEGTNGTGNCAVFAWTVFIDAASKNFQPEIKICNLPDGTSHAFTRVSGWDLDVRHKHPIASEEQDCK